MASSQPMYDYSIVSYLNSLKNLITIFDKAENYAKEQGEDVEDYVKLQIHPDMKNFGYQIQRLSDSAKFVLSRVGGVDSASLVMEDNETTWADYKSRVTKTITALEKGNPKDFEGKEDNEIVLFGGKYKFTAKSYIQTFATPNFYFHVTTAYDLLRMKGVPVGKLDYLAGAGGISQ